MATDTRLVYNGFGYGSGSSEGFSQVRINRFTHTVDASPDKPGRGVTRHTIEGTAIMRAISGGNIDARINAIRAKFLRNGMPLHIYTVDGGTEYDIVDIEGDDKSGPYPSFSVDEIIGSNGCATVSWAFEWFTTDDDGDLGSVREFVCNASFEVDAVGMTTMTRRGYITVTKNTTGLTDGEASYPTPEAAPGLETPPAYGYTSAYDRKDVILDYPIVGTTSTKTDYKYPEQYRRLAAGNLYPGFRRVKQQFATDESRSRMVFEVVDQEYPRGMPGPARVADVSFSFERQINGDGDAGPIGLKVFRCAVSGPTSVAPVDLLGICVRLSQNRINYSRVSHDGSVEKADFITRIAMHERNLLNENTIEFEVVAKAFSEIGSTIGGSGTTVTQRGTPYAPGGMLKSILTALALQPVDKTNADNGTAIEFTFTATSMPDAFGDYGIYRIAPSWYDPEAAAAGNTWDTTKVMEAADKENCTYVFPDPIFATAFESEELQTHMGADNAKQRKSISSSGAVNAFPYFKVQSRVRRVIDPHISAVPSQSKSGGTLSFQHRKPTVIVHEISEGVRMNMAPNREDLMYDTPANAVVLHQDFRETGGVSDMVDNRAIAAVYERVYELTDGGGSTYKEFYNGGTGSAFRQAWPNKTGDDANISGSQSAGDIPLPKLAAIRDVQSGDEQFVNPLGSGEDFA